MLFMRNTIFLASVRSLKFRCKLVYDIVKNALSFFIARTAGNAASDVRIPDPNRLDGYVVIRA